MAQHPIPYISASVPASGAIPASSLAVTINPDPPNDKFGFIGNYHVQARIDGVVSDAPATLGLKGASGDVSDTASLQPGQFTIVLMGSAQDPGDGGFVLFGREETPGGGAVIELTGGSLAAWPSGWFDWQ